MKIFPAVHYSMGGLWVGYEKGANGGLLPGSPKNQMTNIPGLYALGECDYQYHGANRLGANSLLSCIFSGLFVAPGIVQWMKGNKPANELPPSLFEHALNKQTDRHKALLKNSGTENPYLIHQELGDVMTRAATVVRYNKALSEAYEKVSALQERAARCSLSDTGSWTNQNVIFTKALQDMIPLAKCILKGALLRDECRGAHFKPDFAMPSLSATDPVERRKQAEAWCDRFQANNERFLKSSLATWKGTDPEIHYEDVDTSLIEPRPRLYGLVGAEAIEEVWVERSEAKARAEGRAVVRTKSLTASAE